MNDGLNTSTQASWNALISSLPEPHLLQTWEWGQVKSYFGWQPLLQVWYRATNGSVSWSQGTDLRTDARPVGAAMVLQRDLPVPGLGGRLRVLYSSKGPLMDWSDQPLRRRVLSDLRMLAKRQGAIFIKIDPDVRLGTGFLDQASTPEASLGKELVADLQARGWRYSDEQVQFRNTVLIDLTPDENQLLANMKQKMRYNIRLARRKGVTIRVGGQEDLALLYRMYAETSVRDGFVIRGEDYYRAVWGTFMAGSRSERTRGKVGGVEQPVREPLPVSQGGNCNSGNRPIAEPLIAEVDGEPVAAVILYRFGKRAWYLYGMSRQIHREKMPNSLLQWEAMVRARQAGCTSYDLWGAPDVLDESDPLWGVYRFKEGLGGQVVRHIGAWDLPANAILYRLYSRVLPGLLAVMRRRGRVRTLESIS